MKGKKLEMKSADDEFIRKYLEEGKRSLSRPGEQPLEDDDNPRYGVFIPAQFLDLSKEEQQEMWENYYKSQFEHIEQILREHEKNKSETEPRESEK